MVTFITPFGIVGERGHFVEADEGRPNISFADSFKMAGPSSHVLMGYRGAVFKMQRKSAFELPVFDVFKRLDEQTQSAFAGWPKWNLSSCSWSPFGSAISETGRRDADGRVLQHVGRMPGPTVMDVARALTENLAPVSAIDRQNQDFDRAADALLRKHGLTKYSNTKIKNLVVEMLFRAAKRQLADAFGEEKKALRDIVVDAHKRPLTTSGVNKNEDQLPSPATFYKNIKSLEPIYQDVRDSLRSELARIRK